LSRDTDLGLQSVVCRCIVTLHALQTLAYKFCLYKTNDFPHGEWKWICKCALIIASIAFSYGIQFISAVP